MEKTISKKTPKKAALQTSLIRHISLWSLLWLAASALSSQNLNPVAGQLIMTSGDTIVGTINLESESIMARGVQVDTGDGFKLVTPNDIAEVIFLESGLRLQNITHTYIDYERLRNNIEVARLGQLLVDGPIKLLRVPVESNEYLETTMDIPSWVYYLSEEGNNVPLKLEVKEIQYIDRQNVLNEEYKGRLKAFFGEYPKLTKKVDQLRFTDKSLSAIVREYNDLKYGAGKSRVIENKKLTSIRHSVRVLSTYHSRIIKEGSLSNNFGLGYFVGFQNPLSSNALTLGLGIEYFTIGYQESMPLDDLIVREGSILRIPIRTKFALLRKTSLVNPTISGGLNLTYFNYQGEREEFDVLISPSGMTTITSLGYFPFSATDVRFLFSVGAGVEIKSLLLEVFYESRMRTVFSLGYEF